MNKELYTLFQKLTPEGVETLNFLFQNAPKMNALIALLEGSEQSFKTAKVVAELYEEELETTDFKVLINRYHKLRQKLMEQLRRLLKKDKKYVTSEEEQLQFIKYLVAENEFHTALEEAIVLEQYCWKNDLYELLPDILHLIIYCQQCLTCLEDEYVQKLKKAMELQYVLHQLQLLYQEAYFKTNVDDYQHILKKIRKAISKHKGINRFKLIYHYTAFSRGNFVLDVVKKSSNALSRHLNKIETIKAEYPEMPLVFLRLPRIKSTEEKLITLKAIFYFQQSQFAKASSAIKEMDKLILRYPSIEFPLSEGLLGNMIHLFVANREFDLARERLQDLKTFYVERDYHARADYALFYEANIYFYQYPDVNMNRLKQFRNKIQARLEESPMRNMLVMANGMMDFIYGQALSEEFYELSAHIFSDLRPAIFQPLQQRIEQAMIAKDVAALKKCIVALEAQLEQKNGGAELQYLQQMKRIAAYKLELCS